MRKTGAAPLRAGTMRRLALAAAVSLALAGCGSQRFAETDWGFGGSTGAVPRGDYEGPRADSYGGGSGGDYGSAYGARGDVRRGDLAPPDGAQDYAASPNYPQPGADEAPLPDGRRRGRAPGYFGGGEGGETYEDAPRDHGRSFAPPRSAARYQPAAYAAPREDVAPPAYDAPRGEAPAYDETAGYGDAALATHEVGPGDSLYALSRRYNTPVEDIGRANHLAHGEVLAPGRRLTIPRRQRLAEAAPVEPTPYVVSDVAPHLRGGPAGPPPPRRPLGEPVVENDVPAETETETATAETRAPSTAPLSRGERTPAGSSREERLAALPPIKPETPAAPDAEPSADCTESAATVLPRSGDKFREPVSGAITAEFGQTLDGVTAAGITYAVPKGTPVKAAENGVVVYAGDELPGLGNLLLVRHSGGFITAYAHNDVLLVKRCEVVKRGQDIAKAGASGSAAKPQLYFELRKDQKPVDPRKYFAAK